MDKIKTYLTKAINQHDPNLLLEAIKKSSKEAVEFLLDAGVWVKQIHFESAMSLKLFNPESTSKKYLNKDAVNIQFYIPDFFIKHDAQREKSEELKALTVFGQELNRRIKEKISTQPIHSLPAEILLLITKFLRNQHRPANGNDVKKYFNNRGL